MGLAHMDLRTGKGETQKTVKIAPDPAQAGGRIREDFPEDRLVHRQRWENQPDQDGKRWTGQAAEETVNVKAQRQDQK